MFNNDIKERYVKYKHDSIIINKEFLYNIFNKSELFERKLNKDICNFTYYEIIDFYKTINVQSINYLYMINNSFSLYTQWCLSEGMVNDFQNHFNEIKRNTLTECINQIYNEKRIVSREDIIKWCSQLPNPSDAFVIIALFEGLEGRKYYSEIANARIECLHGNEFKTSDSRTIQVSDVFIYYANESYKEDTYYAITNSMSKNIKLVNDGTITKRYVNTTSDNEKNNGRRIYNKVIRSLDYLGVGEYIKPSSIVESGMIHFINEECKKYNITAKEYLKSDYINNVNKQFSRQITNNRINYFLHDFEEFLV